jgi:hypothetical protein
MKTASYPDFTGIPIQSADRELFALESIWAYLPVGPLERQFWEGYQGRYWEGVRKEPSSESFLSLVGHLGEASANY